MRRIIVIAMVCASVCVNTNVAHASEATFKAPDALVSGSSGDALGPFESISVPYDLGVASVVRTGTSDEVIIRIEDRAESLEAKTRVSGIIGYLIQNYGTHLVAQEGPLTNGHFELAESFPIEKARRKAALWLLDQSRISAAEYQRLISYDEFEIHRSGTQSYGVDMDQIYADIVSNRESVDREINKFHKALADVQGKVFEKEIIQLNFVIAFFENKRVSFGGMWDFVKKLVENAGVNLEHYPSIQDKIHSDALMSELNFETARKERKILIDELKSRLSDDRLKAFILNTLKFEAKKISEKAFQSILLEYIDFLKIPRDRYPEFIKYSEYISLSSNELESRVLTEVRSLSEEIKSKLIVDDDGKELDRFLKVVRVFSNLLKAEMAEDDFGFYLANIREFQSSKLEWSLNQIRTKQKVSGSHGIDFGFLSKRLPPAAKFYRYTRKNNRSIVNHVVEYMRDSGKKASIVVSGRYPSVGFEALCEHARVSLISIKPNHDGLDIEKETRTKSIGIKSYEETITLLLGLAVLDGVPLERARRQYLGELVKSDYQSEGLWNGARDFIRGVDFILEKDDRVSLRPPKNSNLFREWGIVDISFTKDSKIPSVSPSKILLKQIKDMEESDDDLTSAANALIEAQEILGARYEAFDTLLDAKDRARSGQGAHILPEGILEEFVESLKERKDFRNLTEERIGGIFDDRFEQFIRRKGVAIDSKLPSYKKMRDGLIQTVQKEQIKVRRSRLEKIIAEEEAYLLEFLESKGSVTAKEAQSYLVEKIGNGYQDYDISEKQVMKRVHGLKRDGQKISHFMRGKDIIISIAPPRSQDTIERLKKALKEEGNQ